MDAFAPHAEAGASNGKLKMRWTVPSLFFIALSGIAHADAQTELSFYGGSILPDSGQVSGSDPGGLGTFSFNSDWTGTGTAGLRLTWWDDQDFGWGIDFQYSGVRADAATLSASGAAALALEDGLSLLTVNAYRRWSESIQNFTPYVGAGLGLAVPSVDFDGGGTATQGRQLGGVAVRLVAGAQYPITDSLSLFGEYQGSFSVNQLDLSSGGSLDTDILSDGVNVGLSLGF